MNNNRYCVVMCGGVGTRFWPFSRQGRPKQFLDFFGTGRSLLQMTVDRILPVVNPDNIILVTNREYYDIIREQLPEVKESNILLEPARRNTAPCVCWAAKHIYAMNPDAAIVTLPSDHIVLKEDAFRKAIEEGFEFVEQGNRLLTLGIKPSGPNTGYGYIQQGEMEKDFSEIFKVKAFVEKPNIEMAEMFVNSGEFFWNAGIFLWTAHSILEAFDKYAPEIAQTLSAPDGVYASSKEPQFIDQKFPNCVNISIDYAIMEKAHNVYVKTVEFGWSDLGTWKALFQSSPRNSDGNVTQNTKVITTDCEDSIFAAEGNKIIVAAGLKNYIVADTEKALLIYPLNEEQKIRNIVNDVKSRFGEEFI
ncbi:MAG: mannose-1-phosphate guanylyltransferase [Muribaculaceae bacterium]|nr:mannose-1-phosphate guanylyltransferase [Muribaculaceae bacterium]